MGTKVAEVPQDLQEGLLWGHGASTPCCGGGEWHKGKVPSHSSVVHTSSSWTLRPAILSMGNGSGRWILRPAMGECEMATAKWKASKAGGLRIRKWFIHRAPGGGYNRNFHDFFDYASWAICLSSGTSNLVSAFNRPPNLIFSQEWELFAGVGSWIGWRSKPTGVCWNGWSPSWRVRYARRPARQWAADSHSLRTGGGKLRPRERILTSAPDSEWIHCFVKAIQPVLDRVVVLSC